MNISFYTISDDNRQINKTLENPLTLSINTRTLARTYNRLHENINKYEPLLLLSNDNFTPDFNYFYIDDWKSYYFITNIEYTAQKIWQVESHIDVLMTFKDDILNATCHIRKTDNLNDYYNGGDYNSLVTKEIKHYYSDTALPLRETNVIMTVGT